MERTSVRLVGASRALNVLRQEIAHAGSCDAKVLITGESGSGKEIVARMIHEASRRRQAPMQAINCAAMAESLLETELFGHARGSFTGAYRDRAGVFEAAHGGTVLLDEIGETSPRMQGMLLRFLETGEVQRVGSDKPHTIANVRIVSATHRVLGERVAGGLFREDLYYRINIIAVRVPPLREHAEDIPEIFQHLLRQLSDSYRMPLLELSADAMKALQAYHWPGNVRELRNVAERLVSRAGKGVIVAADLTSEVMGGRPAVGATAPPPAATRADVLYQRLVGARESFWTVVYEPFIQRDLTREDLRAVVSRGLMQTCGNYRLLIALFNMPGDDYKRFLGFLHKHHCHVPFQQFRSATALKMRPDQLSRHPQQPARPLSA